jgi:hypothetical protein
VNIHSQMDSILEYNTKLSTLLGSRLDHITESTICYLLYCSSTCLSKIFMKVSLYIERCIVLT